MKAVVAAFNQEKALVGAFSLIVQLHRWIDLRHSLYLASIWVMMSLLPLPAADHIPMSRVWELLSGTTAQNYVKITLRPHRLTLKCLIPQTDQILET